jgi:O-Antigen ligase
MRSAAGLLPLSAAAALVTFSLFFGGSLSDSRLFWIGIFAVAVGFGWLAAGLAGLVPVAVPGRAGLAAFGLLAAFVCWNGVTMIWSIAPDLSWAYLNRGAVYVGFALLGLAVAASVRAPARVVAGGLAVLLFGVVGWALLGKVFPPLFPDGARVARLRNPIGYWNALALACALALPLGLWIATRRSWRHELRAAGVVLLYLAAIALVLTFSRAGILVAAVAVVLWLALVPARLESLGALLVSVVPAAAVAGWASTRAGLVDDGQPLGARRSDGAWFGLVVLLVGLGVVAAALWADGLDRRFADPEARRLWARRIGIAIGTVAVCGVIVVSAASGGPGAWLREFRGGGEVSNTSRLGTFSSNNRWEWWQEAWKVFEEKPAGGKGAAAFVDARLRVRHGSTVTNEPHNIALQALAETGIVGFLLGLGAVVAALVAIGRAVTRLRGEERAAAAALAIAIPAFLLHALADIDWDFVAVCAPVFLLGGLLIGIGGELRAVRLRMRPLVAAGVAACLLAAVYSLAAPWLASNRVDDAYSAIFAGSLPAGAADARDAASLNPFSIQPIWALAQAYAALPDPSGALIQYRQATRLQPENPETWVALGNYALCKGSVREAYDALNHAYTLDPFGPAGIPGGPLDQARAAVEKRGTPSCRR